MNSEVKNTQIGFAQEPIKRIRFNSFLLEKITYPEQTISIFLTHEVHITEFLPNL